MLKYTYYGFDSQFINGLSREEIAKFEAPIREANRNLLDKLIENGFMYDPFKDQVIAPEGTRIWMHMRPQDNPETEVVTFFEFFNDPTKVNINGFEELKTLFNIRQGEYPIGMAARQKLIDAGYPAQVTDDKLFWGFRAKQFKTIYFSLKAERNLPEDFEDLRNEFYQEDGDPRDQDQFDPLQIAFAQVVKKSYQEAWDQELAQKILEAPLDINDIKRLFKEVLDLSPKETIKAFRWHLANKRVDLDDLCIIGDFSYYEVIEWAKGQVYSMRVNGAREEDGKFKPWVQETLDVFKNFPNIFGCFKDANLYI